MKVSIVTTTFNSGKTVRDTLESVLHQTYKDIEYIVKDGGSKDDTLDIVNDYKPVFGERLKVISEPDKGIYDAMNKGFEQSTGEIVGILNSDDFFTSKEIIQKVVDAFSSSDIDAVYGDIHFVKDGNLEKCSRYYSSKSFKPWMLRFGFMPAHPSFYCKRSVFDKYGLYDLQYKTSSDFEMMVRLLWNHKIKTKYLNLDFVTMREGGESTSGFASKKKVNQDIARSLKAHGIYTNQMFQMVRYGWKACELVKTKVENAF